MYKCISCGWEFKGFKLIKTDWAEAIESCPNCTITLMEGQFEALDKLKPDNSGVKVIRFPSKD